MRFKMFNYFTKVEFLLWFGTITIITVSFLVFDRESFLILLASLIGATSLIFNAKGNPFGQLLMVIFSLMYGIISFKLAYYGEMITYLGMTAPMAVFAMVLWFKNPYGSNKREVKVNRLIFKELIFMAILTAFVTFIFYYVLLAFNTLNILPSTISVTTSFAAVYLTFRRSAFYAMAYAVNDIVLIVLWGLAAVYDTSYLSMVICFIMFLVNDVYGFASWLKMRKRQENSSI